MEKIRVMICGISGSMGTHTAHAVHGRPDMELVGGIDVNNVGQDLETTISLNGSKLVIEKDLDKVITEKTPQVMIDFTKGHVAPHNIKKCLKNRIACVVGTTGISDEELKEIEELSHKEKTPVLLVPNFSVGAVLMMKFAAEAARHYDNAEIIEMHHDRKQDAPSGTALRTAELMTTDDKKFKLPENEKEKLPGARGGLKDTVRVHSVRLPGLLAHQLVIFGGQGETLTLRHDSLSRECFMPGVISAVKNIHRLTGLAVGLENVL
ncbi:MAG: 4-hydroxy-tetrahydrodipicolinate reductase [Vulcanimicrobiota bacterium]